MFGLFSFVFDSINDVMGQITGFSRQIEDQVQGVINGFVQEVMGGSWRGTGADAFLAEINDVVMPEVVNLIASLTGGGGFTSFIGQAVSIISELDDAINSIGSAIGDVFDSIF